MDTHIIGRQRIRVSVSSRSDADYILAHTGEICRNRLMPLIADALDLLFPGPAYHRIESLTIDVGQLPRDDFERVLVTRVMDELTHKLRTLQPELSPVAPHRREISAMRHYLLTGSYPWYYSPASDLRSGAKMDGPESRKFNLSAPAWSQLSGKDAGIEARDHKTGRPGEADTSPPGTPAGHPRKEDTRMEAPSGREEDSGVAKNVPPATPSSQQDDRDAGREGRTSQMDEPGGRDTYLPASRSNQPADRESPVEGHTDQVPPVEADPGMGVPSENQPPANPEASRLADWTSRLAVLARQVKFPPPPLSDPESILAWMVGLMGNAGIAEKIDAVFSKAELDGLLRYLMPSGISGDSGREVLAVIRTEGERWLSSARLKNLLNAGSQIGAPGRRQLKWLDLMISYRTREVVEVLKTIQVSREHFANLRGFFTDKQVQGLRQAQTVLNRGHLLDGIPEGSLAWRLLDADTGISSTLAPASPGRVTPPDTESATPPAAERRPDLLTALLGEDGEGAAEFLRDLLSRPGGRLRLGETWTEEALRYMTTLDSPALVEHLRRTKREQQRTVDNRVSLQARVLKTLGTKEPSEILKLIVQGVGGQAGVPASVVANYLHLFQMAAIGNREDEVQDRFFGFALAAVYGAEPGRPGVIRMLAYVHACLAAEYGMSNTALLQALVPANPSDASPSLRELLKQLRKELPKQHLNQYSEPVKFQAARIRQRAGEAEAVGLLATFRHRLDNREPGWWELEDLSEDELFERAIAADIELVHRMLHRDPQLAGVAFSRLSPAMVREFIQRSTPELAEFIFQFARVVERFEAEKERSKHTPATTSESDGLAIGWEYVHQREAYGSSDFVGFGIQKLLPRVGVEDDFVRSRMSEIARELVSQGAVVFARLVTVLEELEEVKPTAPQRLPKGQTLPAKLPANSGSPYPEDTFVLRLRRLRYFLLLGAPPPGEQMRSKKELIDSQEELLQQHGGQAIAIYREVLALRSGRRNLFLLHPIVNYVPYSNGCFLPPIAG